MSQAFPRQSDENFVLQQGLSAAAGPACIAQSSALMFQPRAVGVIVAAALILQSAPLFLALSVVLWWSALLPELNPFDALYRATLGRRPDAARLGPALPPRRFSQGMAGTFAGAIGILLALHETTAAFVVEGFLIVALVALLSLRLCLGSFLFHLFAGRGQFAVRTLPWGPGTH